MEIQLYEAMISISRGGNVVPRVFERKQFSFMYVWYGQLQRHNLGGGFATRARK
jgi:hypothetical protein